VVYRSNINYNFVDQTNAINHYATPPYNIVLCTVFISKLLTEQFNIPVNTLQVILETIECTNTDVRSAVAEADVQHCTTQIVKRCGGSVCFKGEKLGHINWCEKMTLDSRKQKMALAAIAISTVCLQIHRFHLTHRNESIL